MLEKVRPYFSPYSSVCLPGLQRYRFLLAVIISLTAIFYSIVHFVLHSLVALPITYALFLFHSFSSFIVFVLYYFGII